MPISCHFRGSKALLFESREQRYNKYPDLYLYLYLEIPSAKSISTQFSCPYIWITKKKLGGNDNLRTFFLLLLIIITINAWHDVCFCDAVYGCPDAEAMAQPGYWFKRHGSHQLEVGCTTSDDTWRMKCDGFNWIGDTQRNCSTTGNIQATGTSALFHYFSLVRYCTNYAGLMIE